MSKYFIFAAGIGFGCLISAVAVRYKGGTREYVKQEKDEDEDENRRSRGIFGSNARAQNVSTSAALSTSTARHVNFLTDILCRLWPYLKVALADTIRETVEPMFKDMMPGPLKNLKFTKLDFGNVPITFDNIVVHELKNGVVQFDWDVLWNSSSDIRLEAGYGIALGVKSVKLKGRMSFLLKPLTSVMPCVEAIQYAFINPPELALDFTGLATVADMSGIDSMIRQIIQDLLASMLVLPERMVFKMTETCDYRDMYTPYLGVARLTLERGRGFVVEKFAFAKDDVPDVYCRIRLGPSPQWKTNYIENSLSPVWENETKDFLLADYDQHIEVEAWDRDVAPLDPDDFLGSARVTVGEILLSSNKRKELELFYKGKSTGAFVSLSLEVGKFSMSDTSSLSRPVEPNRIAGLAVIVVGQAFDLPFEKADVEAFVKVKSRGKEFVTGIVTDYPGCDALNPLFDCAFHVPIEGREVTKDDKSILFELWNKNKVVDSFSCEFDEITKEKGFVKESRKLERTGASLNYMVILEGVQEISKRTNIEEMETPDSTPGTEKIELTILRGEGFKIQRRRLRKDDIPDVYCKVKFGSSPSIWRTATVKDSIEPEWKNESRQFSMSSPNQVFHFDVWDENRRGKDDYLGSARISVGKILLAGGFTTLKLLHEDGSETGSSIFIECRNI